MSSILMSGHSRHSAKISSGLAISWSWKSRVLDYLSGSRLGGGKPVRTLEFNLAIKGGFK
jgi:hypothetical protein